MSIGFVDVRGIVRLCGCGCGQPTPVAKVTQPSRGWVRGEQVRFRQGHRYRPPRTVAELLSECELAALRLVAQGLTSQQAARRLNASERAIDARLHSVYDKLGAASRTHAVVLATKLGLIMLDDIELTAQAAAAVAASGPAAAVAEPDGWEMYNTGEPAGRPS